MFTRITTLQVDPRRLEGNSGDLQGVLAENRKNLLILTQRIFDAIVNSADRWVITTVNDTAIMCFSGKSLFLYVMIFSYTTI